MSALILQDYVDVLNKITESNCFFLMQEESSYIPTNLESLLNSSSLVLSDSAGG